jgi:hypothetical protein
MILHGTLENGSIQLETQPDSTKTGEAEVFVLEEGQSKNDKLESVRELRGAYRGKLSTSEAFSQSKAVEKETEKF